MECGALWSEHRGLGDLVMHPGLGETWDEHVKIGAGLSFEERIDLLRRRRAELTSRGIVLKDYR
jgi:hypothetical protein